MRVRRPPLALAILALGLPTLAAAQPPSEPPIALDPPTEPAAPGAEPSTPSGTVEPGSDPAAEESRLPEAHRPRLEVTLRADEVRTGDLVQLVITAEVPEGDDVGMPEQELGTFEIHDRRHRSEPVEGGARRRFVLELDLLALEPGEQPLPGIRLRVVTADGIVGTVTTEARTVRVGSHIANEPDAQPRPPTPPRTVLEEDYTLAWVLGVLLAMFVAALVGWLVARWWSRRPAAPRAAPPPRPPWEVALEQLEAIRREKTALLASERQAELVDRVSDVVRHYLGQRYDFNGLESTTDEVITRLAKVKLRGVGLGDITALLADSDLVKFAKAVPDEAQCDRMLEGAAIIVRATTPRPEAAERARPSEPKRALAQARLDGHASRSTVGPPDPPAAAGPAEVAGTPERPVAGEEAPPAPTPTAAESIEAVPAEPVSKEAVSIEAVPAEPVPAEPVSKEAEPAWRSPPARAPERLKTGPVQWDRPAAASGQTEDARARAVEPKGSAPITSGVERVLPRLHLEASGAPAGALSRWVTGLERPVLYEGGDGQPLGTSVLAELGLTRGGLHERALANLSRALPPGFAPGDEPALLDDPSSILALPELVPLGHAWVAYPVRGEGLFVLREGAPSTGAELARLRALSGGDPVFERPVRVTRRGFEPLEWPSAERTTDPGYGALDPSAGGEA